MRTLKEHSRGDRRIMQRHHTLWRKTDIRILVYFKCYKNPATYRDIARAYVKSNYATFKKSCEDLKERGYLYVNSEREYFPTKEGEKIIAKEYDVVAIPLPYFDTFRKELK